MGNDRISVSNDGKYISRKVVSCSIPLRRREESAFGMGDGDGDDRSDLTVPMRCTISTSSYLESKSSEGILRASTFYIIQNDVLTLPLCKQLCPNASLAMMYRGQQSPVHDMQNLSIQNVFPFDFQMPHVLLPLTASISGV